MTSYRFRYANRSGTAIRTTIMQCETDAEAIRKACDTMQDRYALLEIFDGERLVYSKFPLPEEVQGAQTHQSLKI